LFQAKLQGQDTDRKAGDSPMHLLLRRVQSRWHNIASLVEAYLTQKETPKSWFDSSSALLRIV
jgi:hypothetical protein